MKATERIDLDLEQVDALLKRVEAGFLQDGDYQIIKAMVETIHLLSQSVDKKAASIRRLLKMLFGDHTEKLQKLIKDRQSTSSTSTDKTDTNKPPRPRSHPRI